ncbi:lysophosphatidylcholine acyltransferase 2B-like [Corticium candelabrum]|uniref:lysophosphatidylcholine acyltransferase 2B-like n=1 Tax=Corticium candelabrum TaxID=121492 RepID=UPI002E267010|nr:lysophosphatidylcholine acyltransferase 2B-like [Corticium candelabrum]
MGRQILRALTFLEAGVNPYVYDYSKLKFTTWRKCEIAIGTVILLPIRMISLVIIMLTGWLLSFIIVVRLKSRTDIHFGWRGLLCWLLVKLARLGLICFGYWHIERKGKQASREDAPVLAVPLHSSWVDFLVTAVVDGSVVPIGLHRKENEKIPFFHNMVVATQQIYVSRSDSQSRQLALDNIKERVANPLSPQVLVFVEGWCTNRASLTPFKKGAFVCGCPIQPVVYRYLNDMDITSWAWNGLHPVESIYYHLCRFVNHMEVEFYDVYTPTEEEKKDPDLYASNIQKMMSRKLGLPTTEYALTDLKYMMGGRFYSVPVSKGMIELRKRENWLSLKLDDVKDAVKDLQGKTCKYVDLQEFSQYVNLPVSSELSEIFDLYDKNDDGKIDLREYLISVVIMCHPYSTDPAMRFAFETFDEDNDGLVNRAELKHVMSVAFHGVDDACVDEVFNQAGVDETGVSYDKFAQFCRNKSDYQYLFRHYEIGRSGRNEKRTLTEHVKAD